MQDKWERDPREHPTAQGQVVQLALPLPTSAKAAWGINGKQQGVCLSLCGIAGIALNSNRTLPDLQERLLLMREAMVHRGPDGAGSYVSPDGRVGLANRRLAIRDLSPAGHMPMCNADGTVWITYNGEIYNTDELRPELERLGFAFHSTSDTEVILHGYEAWGDEVVQRLRGMFAFAILTLEPATLKVQRLFLARDRLGIKL